MQTKRYAWNSARGEVFFAAICDFEQFQFFDASLEPNEHSALDGEAFHLIYTEYVSHIDTLWELSRERVAAGSLTAWLKTDRKSLRRRRPLDKAFLESLKNWRRELATVIHSKNPELDAHRLNDVVQRLLDRIIFIRIAEDRKITDQRQLWEVADYWEQSGGRRNIMDFLLDLFREINENFNGEIFKPHPCEKIRGDSGTLARTIRQLYPPKSNYLFDVVPVELLGSIYERYLGETLRIAPKRVLIEEKPEIRKAGGIYCTPQYIVDYIVKNTVGSLVDDVSGQHMIIRVAKGRSAATPSIIKAACPTTEDSAEPFVLGRAPTKTIQKVSSQLFRGKGIDLREDSRSLLAKIERGSQLQKMGKVRQGIAENPASINRKTSKKYKNRFEVGEGVFALTPQELKRLALPARERALLRPYHDLKDIGRYRLSQPRYH